ncbi:MAG TPA: glycoside hydrolase family 5 protein [Firmicutes bacterium]|nr:glycoside hydrolase family 5 protein [Bacillota bacterium]
MYLAGVNIGGHFSQIEANTQVIKDPFDNFITEEDIRKIKEWGFNCVRFPVDYSFFTLEDGSFDEERMKKTDRIIDFCSDAGLYVIFDLHKAPGHSFAFKERDENDIWDKKSANRKKFIDIWDMLSKRYKNRDKILYEILNEPVAPEDNMWYELADEAIAAIRENDTEHFIVVESNLWGQSSRFVNMKKYDDEKILYSFHFYDPIVVTHQMAEWTSFYKYDIYRKKTFYPGRPEGLDDSVRAKVEKLDNHFATWLDGQDKEWNIDELEKVMKPVLDFKNRHNVPVLCGEFGCVAHGDPQTRINWTRDFMALCAKHGISFTYWNYKNLDFGIYDFTEKYADNPNYQNDERLDKGVLGELQNGILHP